MRRHRVVCWLLPKGAMFDLCVQASSWAFWEEEAGKSSPKVSANLPLLCPHRGQNAHKWSSETLPRRGSQWQTGFNREVRQSSAPMELGARWHITAPLCAAISRMRHRGVGKFASDHQEGGLLVIWPNAGASVATPPPPHHHHHHCRRLWGLSGHFLCFPQLKSTLQVCKKLLGSFSSF